MVKDRAACLASYPTGEARHFLLRDRDGIYGDVVRQRLAAMGIRDRPIAALLPWSNGMVEAFIGSIPILGGLPHQYVISESDFCRVHIGPGRCFR